MAKNNNNSNAYNILLGPLNNMNSKPSSSASSSSVSKVASSSETDSSVSSSSTEPVSEGSSSQEGSENKQQSIGDILLGKSSAAPSSEVSSSASVTSDVGKMVEHYSEENAKPQSSQSQSKNDRQEKLANEAEASQPKQIHRKTSKRHQIPGLNVSPLQKMMRWSVDQHHYVRRTKMEPVEQNGKLVRHREVKYRTIQVRIPEPLLDELRVHYLHTVNLSMSQVRHFTNQDLIILSVLPALSPDVQQAIVDAMNRPNNILKILYGAQVNQINSLSNRKLLISINDKLDDNRHLIQHSRGRQHNFFKRLEIVLFAIFRLLGYIFAGQFNQKTDLANTRRIVQSGSLKDKIKAYLAALESDYVNPALSASMRVGHEEQKRESTIRQTRRQSKNRNK